MLPMDELYNFSLLFLSLNMIIVSITWASFDFRPCKKNFCVKTVPGPTSCLTWHANRSCVSC